QPPGRTSKSILTQHRKRRRLQSHVWLPEFRHRILTRTVRRRQTAIAISVGLHVRAPGAVGGQDRERARPIERPARGPRTPRRAAPTGPTVAAGLSAGSASL